MRNKSLWTQFAILGLSSVLAVSCSKDDDKKNSDKATGPVSAFFKQVSVNSDQGTCTIIPGSNVEGASYQCQVVLNGQPMPWESCAADGFTFPVERGFDTKVKVKAVKDGKESDESLAQTCSVQGGSQDLGGAEIVTEIAEKNQIGQTVAAKDLTVTFGVSDQNINPNEIRYECKRESDTSYIACPLGNTYEFKDLVEGRDYRLEVRAVHIPSGTVGSVDGIAFQVKLPRLAIQGEDVLRSQKQGSVTVTWTNLDQLGATRVLCSVNSGEPMDCTTGGYDLDLGAYPTGAHTLAVSSYAGEALIATQQIPFCAVSCNTDGAVKPSLPQTMPIGKNYVYALPGNMHVTQYSVFGGTSWASNVQFWRIDNGSDPFYPYYRECGVNIMNQGLERRETRQGPNGPLDYCYSTMDPG